MGGMDDMGGWLAWANSSARVFSATGKLRLPMPPGFGRTRAGTWIPMPPR